MNLENKFNSLLFGIFLALFFSSDGVANGLSDDGLKLTGVVFNKGENDSYAIIVNKGKEAHYTIDSELSSGLVLVEIFRKYVLVSIQGKLKRLTMSLSDRIVDDSEFQYGLRRVKKDFGNNKKENDRAREWTEQLVDSISQSVSGPLMTSEMFDISSHVYLYRDDVITSINGIKLDGPMSIQLIVDSVKLSHFIDVVILRDEELHTYKIEMF